MTYYEELGVVQTASREEIRHVYRRLVRLIHPDQFPDEDTRRLADLQMKRLNAILETLSDPAHRDTYDRSLHSPTPVANYKLRSAHVLAAAACMAFAAIAFWPARRPAPQPVTPAPVPAVKRALVRAPRQRPPRPQPSTAIPDAPLVAQAIEILPDPPIAAPLPPVEFAAPVPPHEMPTLSLAGQWLFTPTASAKTTGYAPEYVELRVAESAGVVRGHYRARYRVADQAISPNVDFQFEGRTGPEGGVVAWHGAGGARGEVSLKLLPAGTLEVKWVAQQLGGDLGLVSGAATLVRKLD